MIGRRLWSVWLWHLFFMFRRRKLAANMVHLVHKKVPCCSFLHFVNFFFHFTVQAKQNRQHRAFGPPFSVLVVVYSGRGNSKISLFQRRYSLSQLLWKWMRKIHTELLVKHPPLPLSLCLCSADNFDERVRLWWCDAAHHKYRHPPPQYIYIEQKQKSCYFVKMR